MTDSDLSPDFFEMIERRLKQARQTNVAFALPPELEKIREYARRAIAPIKPSDKNTKVEEKFLFTATRTEAGRSLPPHYLVYFLFVNLLNFRNLGRFEKIAWSIPIDFEGVAFLIEDRKFGLGLFAREGEEENAERIVALIKKGIKVAQPYFKWLADEAIRASEFNIVNNASSLYGRYQYMRDLYQTAQTKKELAEVEHNESQKQRKLPLWRKSPSGNSMIGETVSLHHRDWLPLSNQANWLALSAIEAFFSWTEHIFIHLAILQGRVKTGDEVARLVGTEWNIKFKQALDITCEDTKMHLDKMILIRQQLRNFVAHGAFGKQGEAFHFHSSVGAVPVSFDSSKSRGKFSITENLAFDNEEALKSIEDFVRHLWSGQRAPARLYIQETDLPIILTMATDGKYAEAMKSVSEMEEFIEHLFELQDAYSNMDW